MAASSMHGSRSRKLAAHIFKHKAEPIGTGVGQLTVKASPMMYFLQLGYTTFLNSAINSPTGDKVFKYMTLWGHRPF